MTGISIVGSATVAPGLLLALAAVLSFRARRPAPLLIAGGAIALLAAGVTLGKDLIGRGRPGLAVDAVGVGVGGASFPSGHTTTAVVAAGVMTLLLRGHVSAVTGRTLWWLAGMFALAVGISRIYLDAHWLTDVLAGWALGTALLGVVVLVASRWAPPDPCARAQQRVCDVPEAAR